MPSQQAASARMRSAPVRDLRFWAWAAEIQQYFPYVELSTPDREAFCAGQHHASLGEVELFDMYTSVQTVTQRTVVETPAQSELCYLSLQLYGTTLIAQEDR